MRCWRSVFGGEGEDEARASRAVVPTLSRSSGSEEGRGGVGLPVDFRAEERRAQDTQEARLLRRR